MIASLMLRVIPKNLGYQLFLPRRECIELVTYKEIVNFIY